MRYGESAWTSTPFKKGESDDPWIRFAFRDADPRDDSVIRDETSFDQIARQVWGPLLKHAAGKHAKGEE